jgi:hypothetical protein
VATIPLSLPRLNQQGSETPKFQTLMNPAVPLIMLLTIEVMPMMIPSGNPEEETRVAAITRKKKSKQKKIRKRILQIFQD